MAPGMLWKIFRSTVMSVYEWARQELRRSLDTAQEVGFDPGG